MDNIILAADSYKASHFQVLPPNVTSKFSYIESRGGRYDATLFFGLQYIVKKYLLKPVTMEMIDEAEEILTAHGEPFNREGWEEIVKKYSGYLPVTIKAVKEGTLVPTHNAMVTVESEPGFAWLASYIETFLLRVWYPITVATQSFQVKRVIKAYLQSTADTLDGLPFKLHDFGPRGASSQESAMIGGMAHLVNFMGTDNLEAIVAARRFYNESMAGFSIPALEHSVTTSYGKAREAECFSHALKVWGGKGKLLACVSDTYDLFNAVENIWGEELRQQVIDSGSIVVIRPDSGDPVEIVSKTLEILDRKFGSVVNRKGYRVLNNVRVIQGDGVNEDSILDILNRTAFEKFSTDNLAFGMGGKLLQAGLDRDTQKFAMKASAKCEGGKWIGIRKDPVTDPGKRSKAGRLMLFKNEETGKFVTGSVERVWEDNLISYDGDPRYVRALDTVYRNGQLYREQTLANIRAISETYL